MSVIKNVENLPVTVLPFIYVSDEWEEHPDTFLIKYMREYNLKPYKITHLECDNGGLSTTLQLEGRHFASSTFFRKRKIAVANVIILTLLNIFGYSDTARELQLLFHSKMKNWKERMVAISTKIGHELRLSKSADFSMLKDSELAKAMIVELIEQKTNGTIVTVQSISQELLHNFGVIDTKNLVRKVLDIVCVEKKNVEHGKGAYLWVVNNKYKSDGMSLYEQQIARSNKTGSYKNITVKISLRSDYDLQFNNFALSSSM
jgi:hypothetical protein